MAASIRVLAHGLRRLGQLDAGFLRLLAVAGVGNAVGRALGLVFAALVAALFPPVEYGYIRWAMSAAMLAAIPAAAGPVALARALGAARDDAFRQRGLVTLGLLAIGGMTVLCAAGAAVVLSAAGRPYGGPVVVLVGTTLYSACFGVYRGTGDAWRMAALYVGGNGLQLLLVIVLCWWLGLIEPDLVLVIFGIAWLPLLLGLPMRFRGAVGRLEARGLLGDLWRVWAPQMLAHAAYTAWVGGDLVLVEHFLGPSSAGYYGLAKTGATVFLLVPEAVTMLLLPHVAAQGRQASGLTLRLLLLTAAVSLLLLVSVPLVAPALLSAFNGGRYSASAVALPGVSVGMAIYTLYLVLEGHVVGLGRTGAHAAGISVMAVVTLTTAVLLLPTQGLVGAGLAYAVGASAGFVTLAVVGLRPWARPEPGH